MPSLTTYAHDTSDLAAAPELAADHAKEQDVVANVRSRLVT